MSHGFTVRDTKTGRIFNITVGASTRAIAASWIDQHPSLEIVWVAK